MAKGTFADYGTTWYNQNYCSNRVMTITLYCYTNKEYYDAKYKVKVTKELPLSTRIIFIKSKKIDATKTNE